MSTFAPGNYMRAYKRLLAPLSKPVTIKVRDGDRYKEHRNVMAHVSKWQERDLIAGGTIRIGDLRLIIDVNQLPRNLPSLELKDRIEIDGIDYAVIHWDTETRSLGDVPVAVEATVRG